MEKILVIIDDNGSALGAICKRKRSLLLVDGSGKIVQKVHLKMTIKEAKEILLGRRTRYVS